MAGVLIIPEVLEGQLPAVGAELATEGRRLADEVGGPLVALLVGRGVRPAAEALGKYGVERVLVAEDTSDTPTSSTYAVAAAERAVQETQPRIVLHTHTILGRELAPMLAFRLGAGIVTDCVALTVEGESLVATKPVYGGSAMAEMVIHGTPQLATLRPGIRDPALASSPKQPSVEDLDVSVADERIQVVEEVRAAGQGPSLKDAKIIVAGGRGLGSPDNWHHVEECAEVLGGAVGATRAVTDAGWVPPALQVGLTGATVAPDLYVTVGISGAVQHVAGISGARTVVAINPDREANIFKYARYGVAGDWKEVLPAFTRRLKELKGMQQ